MNSSIVRNGMSRTLAVKKPIRAAEYALDITKAVMNIVQYAILSALCRGYSVKKKHLYTSQIDDDSFRKWKIKLSLS